jgi:flagellar biogenesis protein FliO
MFQLPASPSALTPNTRRLLSRALLFACGLVVLWVALQLVAPPHRDTPEVFTDESGAVATSAGAERGRSLVGPGYLIALALLGAGGWYAVRLRRRLPVDAHAQRLQCLGQLQMAPNQQIRLVSCAGEILLLGVTPGGISLLRSYSRAAFSPERADPDAGITTSASFERLLRHFASGQNGASRAQSQ